MIDVMFVSHITAVAQIQLWTLNAPPPCAQNTVLFAWLTAYVHVLHTFTRSNCKHNKIQSSSKYNISSGDNTTTYNIKITHGHTHLISHHLLSQSSGSPTRDIKWVSGLTVYKCNKQRRRRQVPTWQAAICADADNLTLRCRQQIRLNNG